MRPTRIRDLKMAFHYSDGGYVGGFPAFLGGVVCIAICFWLYSEGLNFYLSFFLGIAIPLIVMALFNHTPHNYCEDIVGRWICDTECRSRLENEPVYSLEFKNDGILIWNNGSKAESFHYKIKGKYVYIDDVKKFKINELWSTSGLWLVECKSKKLIMLNRYI